MYIRGMTDSTLNESKRKVRYRLKYIILWVDANARSITIVQKVSPCERWQTYALLSKEIILIKKGVPVIVNGKAQRTINCVILFDI